MYANIDNFIYSNRELNKDDLTESDRWIISRLNSLIIVVENAYEDYEPTKVARLIQEFVSDDLSNWYVRLNRKRFWKPSSKQSGLNGDKEAAYQTLYNCLSTIAKLSSPIAPFYMDRLYNDLNQVTGIDKERLERIALLLLTSNCKGSDMPLILLIY